MIQRLTHLWISLLITIAMLLLINLVLRDERVKDIAFVVFISWILDSILILTLGAL